jgi:hypothetical protein
MADVFHPAISAWLTDIDRQGKSALTCASYRRALANFVHCAPTITKHDSSHIKFGMSHVSVSEPFDLQVFATRSDFLHIEPLKH